MKPTGSELPAPAWLGSRGWPAALPPLLAVTATGCLAALLPLAAVPPAVLAVGAAALALLLCKLWGSRKPTVDTLAPVAEELHQVQPYLSLMSEQLDGALQQCEQDVLAVIDTLGGVNQAALQQVERIDQATEKAHELAAVLNEKLMVDRQLSAILEMFVNKQERDMEGNAERIARLQEVRALGPMVEVISEVARHIHILSINATIEAARAGESGRGFAVVASEVRRLATITANAAVEISDKIRVVTVGIDQEVDAAMNAGKGDNAASSMRAVMGDIASMHERFATASARLQADNGIEDGNNAIRDGLGDALGLIQFQDVLRQRVGHVQQALGSLNERMATLGEQLVSAEARAHITPEVGALIESLRASYVMDSQRRTHATVTGATAGAATGAERPKIELF